MPTQSLWINGEPIVPRVKLLDGFFQRGFGLMGRALIPDGHAVALRRCRALHTMGMRFALDVVFLDHEERIVRVVIGLRPWRVALGGPNAFTALEFPSDRISPARWIRGARVTWQDPVSISENRM